MDELKYKIDQRMPLKDLVAYGLQWFLIIIPTLIILSVLIGNLHFDSVAEKTFYSQKVFALVGITLLAQTLRGHRLPIVIGPATVLLIGILSATTHGASAVYTAIVLGGALMVLISYTGLLRTLTRFFTPRIIVVILALIAMTLMPTIIRLVFANIAMPLGAFLFALGMLGAMIVLNRLLRGVWKSTVVLWTLLAGSFGYRWLFADYTPLSKVSFAELPWHQLFIPGFTFDVGVLFAFFFCYIALFINEVGSIQAVDKSLKAGDSTNRTMRGLRYTGFSNMLCGLFGVIGTVDFSMSPGIIMNTGCASRYALVAAAVGLIVCALFPQMIVLICAIPEPVLGGVLLFIMVSQLASSFQMMTSQPIARNFADCLTLALPLMMALLISFLPAEVVGAIPEVLRPIATNGFVIGVVTVLLMEHVINREGN